MNDLSSAEPESGSPSAVSPAEAAPVQDAGLVRWATRLKSAGYILLVLAIVPVFLADQYRRIGGLLLVPGLILWWLCLTVRHWCLAQAWPMGTPQRRRGLVITAVLSIPLVLLGISFVWLLL